MCAWDGESAVLLGRVLGPLEGYCGATLGRIRGHGDLFFRPALDGIDPQAVSRVVWPATSSTRTSPTHTHTRTHSLAFFGGISQRRRRRLLRGRRASLPRLTSVRLFGFLPLPRLNQLGSTARPRPAPPSPPAPCPALPFPTPHPVFFLFTCCVSISGLAKTAKVWRPTRPEAVVALVGKKGKPASEVAGANEERARRERDGRRAAARVRPFGDLCTVLYCTNFL